MQLVSPSEQYKDSFIQAVREYQTEKSEDRTDIYQINIAELEKNFSAYVLKLHNHAKGLDLPEGYVPETTYWLIDNDEFIGRVSIRHHLSELLLKEGGHIGYDIRPSKRRMGYGTKMLTLALSKAKELGIENALVTCNVTNIGSKKIIEANGGVLQNDEDVENDKSAKLHYWIPI